jgi:4-amino-4-deoxy-L-arabinose transferase-like glycosyltransferase
VNKERLAFSAITLSGCLIVLLINLGSLKFFHNDEANFIRISQFAFPTFFIERDFEDKRWRKHFNGFGRLNPQVAKYIMGSSLWLHGYSSFDGVKSWNGEKDIEWHVEQGIVPSPGEVYAARLPIAILSAITAMLVGLITFMTLAHYVRSPCIRWLGGLGSVVFFLSHPTIWAYSHRAMLDMPALFFSCLSIVLIIKAMSLHLDNTGSKGYLFSALGAATIGLAISTKLNAALIGFTVGLVFIVFFLLEKKVHSRPMVKHIGRWIPHILFLTVLPIAIFILSNPFLYKHTLKRLALMRGVSDRIADRRGHQTDSALFTLQERLDAFVQQATGGIDNLLRIPSVGIDLLFISIGFFVLLRGLYRSRSQMLSRKSVITIVLAAWVLVTVIGVIWWTPLSWDRYYTPSVPAFAILKGLALAYGVILLGAFFKGGRSSPWSLTR